MRQPTAADLLMCPDNVQEAYAQLRAERDMWKSNHDNQVAIKRAVLDRPDLKERATLVQALISERDQLRADNAVLAAEVRAWRNSSREMGNASAAGDPVSITPYDEMSATDASGALARAKEIK